MAKSARKNVVMSSDVDEEDTSHKSKHKHPAGAPSDQEEDEVRPPARKSSTGKKPTHVASEDEEDAEPQSARKSVKAKKARVV
ncbi:hypothetical protein VTO73DRAFT_13153, partial [Trametes versicolor]